MDSVKKLTGVYRAVVKDNKDPQKQGRLKLEIQTTPGEITDWVWPVETAGITTDAPIIGQGVWVHYNGGDPEFPVWSGTFGKHNGRSKRIHIKPLDNSVSLTGITNYLITSKKPDGTTEVDLTASVVAMANTIKSHETRVTSLESQMATLHSTLATRTSPSHTHGSNG